MHHHVYVYKVHLMEDFQHLKYQQEDIDFHKLLLMRKMDKLKVEKIRNLMKLMKNL